MKILFKKCETADRQKKKLYVIIFAIALLCTLAGYVYIRWTQGYSMFKAPEHDPMAIVSTDILEDDTMSDFEKLPVAEGYAVGLSTQPLYDDGQLFLNLYNYEDNQVWYLVKIYDGKKLIGKSGILYQGEYLESVPIKNVEVGQELTLKIVAYTPDEYHSEGIATVVCCVGDE